MITRRAFIQTTSFAALAGVLGREARGQTVPNSSGTEMPGLKAPPNSCDCHLHIFDAARFPEDPTSPRVPPTHATVSDYRLLQKRIGASRAVVVTPRAYGLDNRINLDALSQFGKNARGVAVVPPTIADSELKRFDAAGIRGIRYSIGDPATAAVSADAIETMAGRVAGMGWHLQLLMRPGQIVALADVFRRLPTPMVFDHMGTPPVANAVNDPSHRIIRELIDKGRTWVKLSAAYSNSTIGPPSYSDSIPLARDFVRAAPERMVWGSDWPHTGSTDGNKPDDARLFDLLADWVPDEATRNRVLVRNPEALYGFEPAAI